MASTTASIGLRKPGIASLMLFLVLTLPAVAYAQLDVDCSGNNPLAYPSIGAALTAATPGTWITVVGTCNESVNLSSLSNLTIAAPWGQTTSVTGGIAISNSQNINLYGLNLTNPNGDGLNLTMTHGVSIDSCTSSNSASRGLNMNMSDAVLYATGAFNNNGYGGIAVNDSSALVIIAYAGPVTITGNGDSGVRVNHSYFANYGNLIITNTSGTSVDGQASGFGIDVRAAANVQMGTIFGENVIANNNSGGVFLQENSSASFWGGPLTSGTTFQTRIEHNGPVGLMAGFGSQVTGFDSLYVSGHTDYGVDVFANGQIFMIGANNQITGNATGTDPLRSGIRIDGNSEAYMRGGQIANNGGAGMTAFANSSLDLMGVQFGGNFGALISCDTSSVLVGDMTPQNGSPRSAVQCASAHNYGSARRTVAKPPIPKLPNYKASHDRWRAHVSK